MAKTEALIRTQIKTEETISVTLAIAEDDAIWFKDKLGSSNKEDDLPPKDFCLTNLSNTSYVIEIQENFLTVNFTECRQIFQKFPLPKNFMVAADNMYNITVVDTIAEIIVFTELHTNN